MTGYPRYRYAFSLTSQFYFCALPLRLDTYNKCLFSCQYCFASARGGRRPEKGLKIADSESLTRVLRGEGRGGTSVIDELVARRQPIHLGGMSDPFPPLEEDLKITLRLLRILADNYYPTVISTKSSLVAQQEYLEVLSRGDFVVQLSFSARDDQLASKIEVGAPSPTERLASLVVLSEAGIKTACRLQPLIPHRESEAMEFLDECAEAGVRHVGVEHLKLPLETWAGIDRLAKAMSWDLRSYYAKVGAKRCGREWLLPVDLRLPTILKMRDRAHALGMSFGAADTDLLPISDSACCCSGADMLLRGGRPFEFNYLGAVRRATSDGIITFASLDNCWTPVGSIAPVINSHSRIRRADGTSAAIADYIRANWNGRKNGCSPQMFYGIEPAGQVDDEGLNLYIIRDAFKALLERTTVWSPG